MSVRTGLPDHTMQTKFQSQRPSDVEKPGPSIWVQKLSSIGAVSNWMGERQLWVCVHPISKEKAEQLLATIPVSCHHIVRNWSKALHYIRIVESISMHSDYRTVLHNQPIWDSASASSSSSSYCAQHISTSWHFVYGLWHDGAELFLLLMLQKMPGVCGRVLSN
jgi:hypothetical protein